MCASAAICPYNKQMRWALLILFYIPSGFTAVTPDYSGHFVTGFLTTILVGLLAWFIKKEFRLIEKSREKQIIRIDKMAICIASIKSDFNLMNNNLEHGVKSISALDKDLDKVKEDVVELKQRVAKVEERVG